MNHPTLRTRLFTSYALVAAAGAATVLIAARLLVPRLFDERMRGAGKGPGSSNAQMAAGQHDAVVGALDVALAIGFVASLAAAAIVAVAMARRVLRPIDDLRAATARLAAGRYDEPVSPPTEPELAALADDVNRLANALAETEHRRAALIGDIAHEMRTPLTTITGYVDGLGDGLFSQDEMIATVSDETARLRRLAGDLAAVSRAEEGQLALELRSEDLAEIIGTVAGRLRPQFDDKSVGLTVDTPVAVDVTVDRERLVQAATNLLSNALAYTPTGGNVHVAIGADARFARVSVADSGRGIAPDDTERIFERFYRADPQAHVGGTGIGLTIARAIARGHGGDLTATSQGLGLGATFTLTVPLSQ